MLDLSTTEQWYEYGDNWFFVEAFDDFPIFDTTLGVRIYEYSWAPLYRIESRYASGIGLIYTHTSRHNEDDESEGLSGCITNGEIYGALLDLKP